MSVDIREKVKKLLALSKSSNEHEAHAAMIKARELMAKHKLDELDFKEEKMVIKRLNLPNVTYSKRRDSWICALAETIVNNYCCSCIHVRTKRTYTVSFMGKEEDVDVCESVFIYALECVRAGIKEEKKKYFGYNSESIRIVSNSYAYGFVKGLKQAFDKQNQENERDWGLVMVVPNEVKDYIENNCTTRNFESNQGKRIHKDSFNNGIRDGKEFTERKRLDNAM